MGKRLNEVRAVLGPYFEAGMAPKSAAKSAAIRISIPRLNGGMAMTQQEQTALVGIQAANRLLAWFLVHQKPWLLYVRDALNPIPEYQ
jgi:hypothetical protein